MLYWVISWTEILTTAETQESLDVAHKTSALHLSRELLNPERQGRYTRMSSPRNPLATETSKRVLRERAMCDTQDKPLRHR